MVENSSPSRSGVASYRSRQPAPPVSGFFVVAIAGSVGAWLPERLHAVVGEASEYEEEVGKPVQVDRGQGVRVRNGQNGPLRSTADRAGDEDAGGALLPAGQDEALQLRQSRVLLLDLPPEPLDRGVGDAQAVLVPGVRDGQVRAEIEELVGDAVETTRPADERVQLVDVPHRGDARVEL